MSQFETQQECFSHVVNGNSIYLKDINREIKGIEIKFVDGTLCAYMNGEWIQCPVLFEHPRLFSC